MVSLNKGGQSTMALSCSQAKLWVNTHYEWHDDGVVAKSVMYKHYEDYCRSNNRNTMETSIFGRVVKSVFPDVPIRRLGGRDNLKYYYCGIRAKESSPHAEDNATTTRPKRRLRKRELSTDKAEVHQCLKWLHANYIPSADASVNKSEVYARYVQDNSAWSVEPLSQQYFGMVISHAFPRITKRKLGPRTNQQKFYFGIQDRPVPLDMANVPMEVIAMFEMLFNKGRLNYREGANTPDDDEDDELACRSPASDGSDLSGGALELSSTAIPEHDLQSENHLSPYHIQVPIKEEPVDYSLSTLRLKDEPLESMLNNELLEATVKEEPLDLHKSQYLSVTPDLPQISEQTTDSPCSPTKDAKNRKIYKPRFHIDYHDENSWNSDSVIKIESDDQLRDNSPELQWDSILREWIFSSLQECKGVCINRDQVFAYYEKFCMISSTPVLPLTHFDETVLKTFPGVVTMMHSAGSTISTYYEGLSAAPNSDMYRRVDELFIKPELTPWSDTLQQHSMELTTESGASPVNLDDDDDDIVEESMEAYECDEVKEDLQSMPEVLKDGKFYLKMWLMENFESVPESCVLKADAYKHYEAYAKSIMQTPFEMNVFGKIVRQVFPTVTIRRLGGRVKPQYHYCGIAVKPTSSLYGLTSGKDPAQRSRKKEIATDNRSAEIVIDWLRRMYHPGKERAIMKGEVYISYCKYCSSIGENPVRLNYFGKLVKHCFPHVEVRKFGGRSEPLWYYLGLIPRDYSTREQNEQNISADDYTNASIPSTMHENEAAQHCYSEDRQLKLSSPIPIVTQPGLLIRGTPSYSGSPQIIVSSVSLNQQLQSQLKHSPYNSLSPRDLQSTGPLSTCSPDVYSNSPAANLGFRESLGTRSPIEGGRIQEIGRRGMVYVPYEPADVAPDTMFPRPPGDTSAQICRSPAGCSGQARCLVDTGSLFSQSPVEGVAGRSGGGQVVPSQTPPSTLVFSESTGSLRSYKRLRPELGPDDYHMFPLE